MGKVEESKQASSPAKRGINWLTVIGIVVLILLVAVVIYATVIAKQVRSNPAIMQLEEAWPYINAMNDMTQAQIRDQAREMTVRELLLNPEAYKGSGQYVVVTGGVANEESMLVSQQMARDVFTDDVTFGGADYDFKGYILGDGLVVVDITGEGPDVLPEGAEIRGFGRVFVLKVSDIFQLPWVGPDLEKQFNNVEGMSDQVVFLFSKGVEVVLAGDNTEVGGNAPSIDPNAAEPTDGTVPPADGMPGEAGETPAPPADGSEPPAAPEPGTDPGAGGA